MNKIQIFISYKYHGEDGRILPDYYMAKELYEKLTSIGLKCFFSDQTILKAGQGDYKRLIDEYLDEAKMLVVVSTSPEHCNSNWVRYEWDSFYNDILSEQKDGELISYLDAEDIRKFPRTIRTLQVFEKKKDGLSSIITFIKSYFNISELSCEQPMIDKGSSYNYDAAYELGDERKRLAIQGKVESKEDYNYISELLQPRADVYNILDVGCSMGNVTFDVFGGFGDTVSVIGVDKFQKCIDSFNKDCPDNMRAELLNFEDPEWESQLEQIMNKYGVSTFDLVYCSLSLHHLSDSESVIRKLWKYITDDGYIYIRTCDDALKIAYPHESYIYEIIQKTANVPHVSDRFHGRKIYSMLYKARYMNIAMKSFLIDTGYKDIDERYALFYSAFVWRKNYFKNQLKSARSQEEIEKAMAEYNDVMILLDKIESLFTDKSFYFGYYVTIAIGQKHSFW
ncbi:MAG: methyltransferase domain-containing protein [Oscillospiraceae bacterium]|nr:methyltransferase domain-containing protein [Oscillospiraceae bacterium]